MALAPESTASRVLRRSGIWRRLRTSALLATLLLATTASVVLLNVLGSRFSARLDVGRRLKETCLNAS